MPPTKIYGIDQIRDRTITAVKIGLGEITNAEISASAAIALSKLAEAVIQADGGQAFTGNQSMGSHYLTDLLNPVNPQDAATKDYVDDAVLGAINYVGTIDMSVDPGLAAPGAGNDGDLYIVSVASSGAVSYANLPASTVYNVGDWIISHGSGTWDYVGAEDASSSNIPFTTVLRNANGGFYASDVYFNSSGDTVALTVTASGEIAALNVFGPPTNPAAYFQGGGFGAISAYDDDSTSASIGIIQVQSSAAASATEFLRIENNSATTPRTGDAIHVVTANPGQQGGNVLRYTENSVDKFILSSAGVIAKAELDIRDPAFNTQLALSRFSSDNAAFGRGAGNALSSGTGNTLFGTSAGSLLTTGANNTFIGSLAGFASAADTISNVGIGVSALANIGSAGSSNVAVGNEAGGSAVAAYNNSLLGFQAGLNITGGHDNLCLGYTSGAGLTTGNHNAYVGAGIAAAAAGHRNVYIGYGISSSSTYSDSIAIGYQALITADSQLVINRVTTGYFGNGVTASSPAAFTFNATGGSGTNIAGASLTIAAGKGTGNAAGGALLFQTSNALGSGSTLQSLTTKMQIAVGGGITATSYMRLGSLSAPSNTTAGDLNAIRAFIGADAALLTGLTAQVAGAVGISAQNALRLYDGDNSNYIGLRANTTRSTDIIYDLPITDPTSGQWLKAAAPGGGVSALSWGTIVSADISDASINPVASTIALRDGSGGSGFASIWGSTASGGDLTIYSTSHATKGNIFFGTSTYDEVNNRLGIANASPSVALDVTGAGNFSSDLLAAGYGRFGSVAAPSNTTAGDLNAIRAFIGADAALLTGLTAQVAGAVGISAQNMLRLYDGDNSNYIGLRADAARTTNLVYELPITDPAAGQVLSAGAPSGGVSVLSWANATALAGVDVNATASTIPIRTATGGANFGERVHIKASTAVPASNLLHLVDNSNNDLFRFDYQGLLQVTPPGATGGGVQITMPSGNNSVGLTVTSQQNLSPGYIVYVDGSAAGLDMIGVYSNAKAKAFMGESSIASAHIFHAEATHTNALPGYFLSNSSVSGEPYGVLIQKVTTSGTLTRQLLEVAVNKTAGSWSGDMLLFSEGGSGTTLTGNVIRHYDGSANKFLLDFSGNLRTAGYARVGSVTAPTNVTAGDLTSLRALIGADSAMGAGMTLDVNGLARVRNQLGIGALANASYDLNLATGTVLSGVAATGSAIGFTFNTPAYATNDKLLSLQNNSVAKFEVKQDGAWVLGLVDLRDSAGVRTALAYSSVTNTTFGWASFGSLGTPSGTHNSVFGYNAGNSLTTGSGNAFFGDSAGALITDGDSNTVFGYQALVSQSGSGTSNNSAFGMAAGHENTTGYDNVYFGEQAGYWNQTGIRNTLIGRNGGLQSLGSGCVSIGYQSGRISAGTYNYSIAIGYEAVYTASNQLVIGGGTDDGGGGLGHITDAYIGGGVTNTSPTGVTIHATGGSGTDIAGAALTIAGGRGTGDAAGGAILFQTTASGQGTGTTLRTLTTKMTLSAAGDLDVTGNAASRAGQLVSFLTAQVFS